LMHRTLIYGAGLKIGFNWLVYYLFGKFILLP
jgi:hypothetical protein